MSLQTLFTEIANAIRAKDGTTGTIAANTFPARIQAIPSGGGTASAKATLEGLTWTAGTVANGKITFTLTDTSKTVLVLYTLNNGGYGLGLYAYDTGLGAWMLSGELSGQGNLDVSESLDGAAGTLKLEYGGLSAGVEIENGVVAVLPN